MKRKIIKKQTKSQRTVKNKPISASPKKNKRAVKLLTKRITRRNLEDQIDQ